MHVSVTNLVSSAVHATSALNNCGVDLFIKVGTLLPEMSAHEKTLDHFIDMLRKDQVRGLHTATLFCCCCLGCVD